MDEERGRNSRRPVGVVVGQAGPGPTEWILTYKQTFVVVLYNTFVFFFFTSNTHITQQTSLPFRASHALKLEL